ncbi:substrate-binding domain-containing protein [Luteolibacter algae]|uniref:Substrate-binding domain-containing protein n=1 Tax=Luteolibacter algae TaxID=454151 RepID=A0ABW5D9E8_9BACT
MPPVKEIPQVAIFVSTSNSWGRSIVKGIISYANEVGPWHIWVRTGTRETLEHLPRGWRGDGIIARVATPSFAEDIKKSQLPVVNVCDFDVPDFASACVRTDDSIGTKLAVEHFIDRGINNVALAGPFHLPNPAAYSRHFKNAVSQHKLPYQTFALRESELQDSKKLAEWINSQPKPLGLLVWGNEYARQVVDCCMQENISVPHDVAILSGGYDELLSHACFPALSGIMAPTEQIGYKAAELLHLKLLGEPVENKTIYLPPMGIIERLSTDTLAVEDPRLVQVIQYIRDHAFEPISMDDILRAVPMARRSLENRFQRAFGRSPTDEVRRIRIKRASKLLSETDLPMQDVAEACGYTTYNYLSHVFKKSTGQSPRQFRKQFRI